MKNQKIIYPTSNSKYGIGTKNKYSEEKSALNPISLYGITEAKEESLVLSHGNSICLGLAKVFRFS